MRFRLVTWLLLGGAVAAQDKGVAERFLAQEEKAFVHYHRREWSRAIAAFEQQIAIFSGNPRPYYNIACCYGLQGDAERAGTWLSLAIAHGWRDDEHLGKDPDFAQVRESAAYRACLDQLAQARRADPAPLPRRIPAASVPGASSARAILTASAFQRQRLEESERLLEEHQFRTRLFDLYDRRMARLTRYVIENGDAPDADLAASARVSTALLYLARATRDDAADLVLRRVAARYVLATAEEFLRGYPGSARLAQVLLWRAEALRSLDGKAKEAEEALRAIIADHPVWDAAAPAQVQLCALLADQDRREELKREYAALKLRWGGQEEIVDLMRYRLTKARLLAEGLPSELRALNPGGGPFLYVFVSIHSVDSELRLKRVRALAEAGQLHAVAVCVDEPARAADEDVARWLKEHAAGLATVARGRPLLTDLVLSAVPTLILARDDAVLAFDPTDKELDGLLGGGGSG
ncbi:MAG: TPR end-of-group domain-containing protein [Planctomycetota bacterium]